MEIVEDSAAPLLRIDGLKVFIEWQEQDPA
jgi:hypothetical protein